MAPQDLADPALLADAWIPPLEAVAHLPRIELGQEEVDAVGHGRPASAGGVQARGTVVACHGGSLVAVGEVTDSLFRPKKVFTGE